VLLFHHALGRTAGVIAFGDRLRAAGHVVHIPDLFDGRLFATIDEGVAHAEAIGMDVVIDRGVTVANDLPDDVVYAGFSLGVLPAPKLAQTRPGAKGALLMHACVPAEFFGPWPPGVSVQVHAMERDPIFTGDGDLDAARALTETVDRAELFLYPGEGHCFADHTLPGSDPDATEVLIGRALDFLAST
jgi:dienelactone hydrolase